MPVTTWLTTLIRLPPIDKLNLERINHAELAVELMHTNKSNIFCVNDCTDNAWEKLVSV